MEKVYHIAAWGVRTKASGIPVMDQVRVTRFPMPEHLSDAATSRPNELISELLESALVGTPSAASNLAGLHKKTAGCILTSTEKYNY